MACKPNGTTIPYTGSNNALLNVNMINRTVYLKTPQESLELIWYQHSSALDRSE